MTIKKTFIWTGVHTAIKILSGIVMNKIIAVYLGPSGLALIGQFQNFSQLVVNIATGSIHTGIIKYTAEHKEDADSLNKIWNNALLLNIILSVVVTITIMYFHNYFSKYILFSYEYSNLMIVFSLSIILYALNMYIISILNGLQNIKLYTLINIIISLVTLAIITYLSITYKMIGALYALIVTQSFVFFISFFLIYKKYKVSFFKLSTISKNVDIKILKKLISYGMVSFTSGVTLSIMLLIVRYIIQADASIEYAGYWEALWKISVYFTMISMLPASIYYLPKYSSLGSVEEIKSNFFESLKFFLPLQIFVALILFYFKLDIIKLLFTDDFILIAPVLVFMLIGDVLRVCAYLIVNIMYAKGFMLKLVILDISYNMVLVILIYFMFKEYSLRGLGYSYLIANIFVLTYVLRFYFNMEKLLKKGETIAEK